jgi:hypothetical protein
LFTTGNKFPEYSYTKRELLNKFKLPEKFLLEEQLAATFFIFKVSNFSKKIVKEWLEIATSENYSLIDDSLILPQHERFIVHRHDQAIISMLAKKNKLSPVYEKSAFPGVLYYKNSPLLLLPFHALRNKSKQTFIKKEYYEMSKPSFFGLVTFNILYSIFRVANFFSPYGYLAVKFFK